MMADQRDGNTSKAYAQAALLEIMSPVLIVACGRVTPRTPQTASSRARLKSPGHTVAADATHITAPVVLETFAAPRSKHLVIVVNDRLSQTTERNGMSMQRAPSH